MRVCVRVHLSVCQRKHPGYFIWGLEIKIGQALEEGVVSTFLLFVLSWIVLSLKIAFALDLVFCQNACVGALCRGSNLHVLNLRSAL